MSVRSKCNDQMPHITNYEGQYRTSSEYVEALRKWMGQMYQVQCIAASFPLFLAGLQQQAQQQSSEAQIQTNSFASQQTSAAAGEQTQEQQQHAQEFPRRGVEYVIPRIWKRIGAEAIDFFLLFIIKLAVTYVAVDTFDILDIENYNLETLRTDLIYDYKIALDMTSGILVLEFIHRIGTCVFEALCLHRGALGMGGATPGKRVFGLRVVRCQWVAPTARDQAVIFPATDLGLGRALLRSVVKNFAITFLFPICFTLFSFQHNRTLYDILAGSIVVEDKPVTAHRGERQ